MSHITYKMTVATNVGLVRTNNEDNFIVSPDLASQDWFIPHDTNNILSLGNNGCLLAVADGMGGMNAGEVASAIAIDTIREFFSEHDLNKAAKNTRSIEAFLKKAIIQADSNIKSKVKSDSSTSGMGTTIVLAWVLVDRVYLAWCGDSRAYLFNNALGLTRLTKDHSYVQELVDNGKLDPELAFDHPNSNIITRSLGDSASKAIPDFVEKKLQSGDLIIICSDGLCGLVRDDDISEIIQASDFNNIENIKANLISAALEAGGLDNVTVGLFQCLTTQDEISKKTLTGFENIKGHTKNDPMVKEEENVAEEDKQNDETPLNPEPIKRQTRKHLWLFFLILAIVLMVAALCAYFKIYSISGLSDLFGKQ